MNANGREVGCLVAGYFNIWKEKSKNREILGRSFGELDRDQGTQHGLISMNIAGLEVAGNSFILVGQRSKAGIASNRIMNLDMVASERELICHISPPDVIAGYSVRNFRIVLFLLPSTRTPQ